MIIFCREDRESVAISLLAELNSRLQNRAREVRLSHISKQLKLSHTLFRNLTVKQNGNIRSYEIM